MQNVGFEQTTTKFMESFVAKEYFFLGKAVMETISVAITGSSNMHCLDIYLTNILGILSLYQLFCDFKHFLHALIWLVPILNAHLFSGSNLP